MCTSFYWECCIRNTHNWKFFLLCHHYLQLRIYCIQGCKAPQWCGIGLLDILCVIRPNPCCRQPRSFRCPSMSVADITDCATSPASLGTVLEKLFSQDQSSDPSYQNLSLRDPIKLINTYCWQVKKYRTIWVEYVQYRPQALSCLSLSFC